MATEQMLRATLALYHNNANNLNTGNGAQLSPVAQRVFASTTSLLTNLSNPLNVSLLISHFLVAPVIWQPLGTGSDGSNGPSTPINGRTCFRVISVFNTAAIHVRRKELEEAAAVRHGLIDLLRERYQGYYQADNKLGQERRLTSEAWALSVAEGADSRSPRWRHLLVLVGVLMGFEGDGRRSLSRARRTALEQGVATAANLALEESVAAATAVSPDADLIRYAVVLGLTFAFPLLQQQARASLNCDLLLPSVMSSLAGPYGFQGGRILEAIEIDPHVTTTPVLHWPPTTLSFQHLKQELETQPLVTGAGPVATLAAYAVQNAQHSLVVLQALDAQLAFTNELATRWTACRRLSGFDASDEASFISPETAQTTWPVLWQHFKRVLYTTALTLQAMAGRSLLDRSLAADNVAPVMASKMLHILRNLAFISTRQDAGSFQAYRFAYLASIDILSRYRDASESLLRQLVPVSSGIPLPPVGADPVRLTADLFYLNLAEHFAATLSPASCDLLLIQPALPYVSPPPSSALFVAPPPSTRMVETFEAAHSATLSVLSVPHNAAIAASLSPFYAEALFASFPVRISARQFRVAFKTLIQIMSPPFPVYLTHPDLAETLLEMVRIRAAAASTVPLPPAPGEDDPAQGVPPASEQSSLVLTLVDALPFLALPVLEEWMTTAAEAVWLIGDASLRQPVQQRFWDVLGNGEMDVERAAVGVAWWGNGGGGDLVMLGGRARAGGSSRSSRPGLMPQDGERPTMSGAIPDGQVALTKL